VGHRPARTGRWVALAVGAVVVGLLVMLATRAPGTERATRSPLLGRPAPEITGTSLLDGSSFDLATRRGRWVVVNFFASWCIPCKQEHPELVAFSQKYALSGEAEVVSVTLNDTVEGARAFFAENGGQWPVIADTAARFAAAYGAALPPETYVVDPDGIVRRKVVGATTSVELDRLIADAAQERAEGRLP
jgi:cytochrome c biogenesis protein CcmG/thiol:disulfide interchange protein DsbE